MPPALAATAQTLYGTLGLGPIQACARRLSGALAQAAYADTWFDQSGVPGGTLTTDQALTAEQATQWRDQWHESVKGRRTAVLGSGLQYAPIHLTPEEAQWIEGQRFSVTAVARMFGIPPRLILAAVDGSSSTYSNLQQDDLSFVRWTLMAYLREIEAGLSQLLPRGVDARFNLDALLRPDTTTRYAAHLSGLDGGFLTVDEVRATEGLPPLHTTPTSEVTP